MDKIELLKHVVALIEEDELNVGEITALLSQHRIQTEMHVGQPPSFFEIDTHKAEYLLGQLKANIEYEVSGTGMSIMLKKSLDFLNAFKEEFRGMDYFALMNHLYKLKKAAISVFNIIVYVGNGKLPSIIDEQSDLQESIEALHMFTNEHPENQAYFLKALLEPEDRVFYEVTNGNYVLGYYQHHEEALEGVKSDEAARQSCDSQGIKYYDKTPVYIQEIRCIDGFHSIERAKAEQ